MKFIRIQLIVLRAHAFIESLVTVYYSRIRGCRSLRRSLIAELLFFANEEWHLLRRKESSASFIIEIVSYVKQIGHCGSNGLFLLLINPY